MSGRAGGRAGMRGAGGGGRLAARCRHSLAERMNTKTMFSILLGHRVFCKILPRIVARASRLAASRRAVSYRALC